MNPSRLFLASRVALVVTAMSFALRAAATGAWESEFHLNYEQVGWVNSAAFWGFTLAMMFGGPLCDLLGLKRIMVIATAGHLAGIILTVFAWDYWSLFVGTLIFGIANGSVEAVCNPLIATIFPEDKTTRLNHFHVWFPGGIVIGGLLSFVFAKMGMGWKVQFASMLVPLAVYTVMFSGQSFPKTERVQQGVTTGQMFTACLHPMFILMVLCMFMTASTEFGPNQWIPNILSNAGVSGILVLVWITGLMALGRQFAGPFVHRLSPLGMLLASAVLGFFGLLLMSRTSGVMLFGAATIFAIGVCFFWPTMLGFVNERYPKTGALGLAIMGGAGMLSSSFVLPTVGKIYDHAIVAATPADVDVAALAAAPAGSELAAQWMAIQAGAGLDTIGKIAVLPGVLTVIFLVMFVTLRPKRASLPGTGRTLP
jgi:MFS family permease